MSAWEESRSIRKDYVLRGDRTVTVKEPCRINGEMCVPGIARFAADYDAVIKDPHLFEATYAKDRETAAKLRGHVERVAVRHAGRYSRKTSPVPRRGAEPWRLR